jgi:hypothetical protein
VDFVTLDQEQADLIDYDVFASIYNEGKFALLASWRDWFAAERFKPLSRADLARRKVRREVADGRETSRHAAARPRRGVPGLSICG